MFGLCLEVTSLDHFLSNFVTLNSISYYTSTQLTVFLDESPTFAMVLHILWVGFSELHKKINFYKVFFRKAYISLTCSRKGLMQTNAKTWDCVIWNPLNGRNGRGRCTITAVWRLTLVHEPTVRNWKNNLFPFTKNNWYKQEHCLEIVIDHFIQ